MTKFDSYQQIIEEYRNKFEKESLGYKLPEITYVRNLQNFKAFDQSVDTFIAIPIKNQEGNISQVLEKLEENIGSPYILGLLFDGCTDKSLGVAMQLLERVIQTSQFLFEVHVIASDLDLFESTCENLLFQFCKTRYFATLQADIFFTDPSFIPRARRAFREIPELLGLSGRAIVRLKEPVSSENMWIRILRGVTTSKLLPLKQKNYRRLGFFDYRLKYFGDISFFPSSRMKFTPHQKDTVFLGPAIIRGPIVWDSAKFKNLGGFNDLKYFLGRDDCDLSLRAQNHNLVVGYLPCVSYSPPELGTTRKPRTEAVMEEMRRRSNLAKLIEGSLDLYWDLESTTSLSNEKKFWKTVTLN